MVDEIRTEEADYDPYYEGMDDYQDGGDPRILNPYLRSLNSYHSWMAGWKQAEAFFAKQDEEDAREVLKRPRRARKAKP